MNVLQKPLETPVPWTKLQGTEIWKVVQDRMNREVLKYHNFGHVCDLYNRADQMNMEYDAALDYAILLHDVYYAAEPDLELKSMSMGLTLMQASEVDVHIIGEAVHHISKTARHSFLGDNRLVLLDLMGFAQSVEAVDEDNRRIIEELWLLYPAISFHELKHRNFAFLTQLHKKLVAEVENDWTNYSAQCIAIVDGLGSLLARRAREMH